MKNCLKCYGQLLGDEQLLHRACSQTVFGRDAPPQLDLSPLRLEHLGQMQLNAGQGLTGVQAKISSDYINESGRPLLMNVMRGLIIKPQSTDYPHLPENEGLCMQMAELVNLPVVPHTLHRTLQGDLVYVTKRIDRDKNDRAIQQEDMAQILGRLTEDKYKGSHEQIGKAIKTYSQRHSLDLITYFRAVIFCYLIGNNDAHLKNWSLHKPKKEWRLMPLYDLVAARLVIPISKDSDDLAIVLSGRKHGFTKKNFDDFATSIGIPSAVAQAQISRLLKSIDLLNATIERSYLPSSMQADFKALLTQRAIILG